MNKNYTIAQATDFLLEFAVHLMAAGSHTARVIRNVSRVADALDYKIEITIFQRNITMMVINKADSSLSLTAVKRIPPVAINYFRVSELSRLSWDAYDNRISFDQIRQEYRSILSVQRMNRWAVLFLVAVANASFCHLFHGDYIAMGFVFIATLVGFFLRQEMVKRHTNHFVMFITVSFIASIIAGQGVVFSIGSTPEIALATSVLFLIPGVPLINSIADLLEGYMLNGISRLVNASLLILSIAMGFLTTLFILGIERL